MLYVFAFLGGGAVGAVIVIIIFQILKKKTLKLEEKKQKEMETVIANLKESFGSLSREALSKNTDEFLKFAKQTLEKQTTEGTQELEGKKKLIDQTLDLIKTDLKSVEGLIGNLQTDRKEQLGELREKIDQATKETEKLRETTGKLQTALASSKTRGQWGERMAEDVLRLAGFLKGTNYLKQDTSKTTGNRPDYTFLLPQNLKLNMDVKFPLDNYTNYLNADSKTDRAAFKKQFLKDAKKMIDAVATRDYINPADHTVDYALVFIPNEQVYAFLHQNDQTILDEALKKKVILCSPITLYAILAVIRQAVDNFNLEQTTAQILALLGDFNKQWGKFKDSFGKLGDRIEKTKEEYTHLTTTRSNKLDKPLREIEDLRKNRNIEEPRIIEGEYSSVENSD